MGDYFLFCFRSEGIHGEQGWPLMVWLVAASFAGLLCDCDTGRLKVCDNENCGWVFYDESKNKSRRWCDSKVCGNIMKVRRFRSRQKAKKEEDHEKQDQGNRQTKTD